MLFYRNFNISVVHALSELPVNLDIRIYTERTTEITLMIISNKTEHYLYKNL